MSADQKIDYEEFTAAPCQAACPAGIDVPSYVTLIGHGRYREAVDLIRKDNPFPWVCGLVCTHPCQEACVKGYDDKPIAIMELKAFAAAYVDKLVDETVYPENGSWLEKVAIVGAGPAGLTAAYYLAEKGYQVTVFEALAVAGGMLAVGIPEYRLPRYVIEKEISRIKKMGVVVRTNTPIGGDYDVPALRRQGYKAFFLALGAHRGMRLAIPGENDFPQVWDAVTFLHRHYLGEREKVGRRVAVIGGGNAAMDAARICLRLGSDTVDVLYRRTRDEMPALKEEIQEAEEEGIEFRFLTIPKRIIGSDGRVTGVECIDAELGTPDASGRRRPVPIKGSEHVVEADAVIATIGQSPDIKWIGEQYRLEVTRWQTIATNAHNMQTSIPDVFAGGDVVSGPSTVVQAIAAGKKAAAGIDAFLRGKPLPDETPEARPRMRVEPIEMEASEKVMIPPYEPRRVASEMRKGNFEPIQIGMSEEVARQEARRCLRCDLCAGCGECEAVCHSQMNLSAIQSKEISKDRKTLINLLRPGEYCVGGGGCANACPRGCLKIVDEEGERRLVWCGTVLARFRLARCESCQSYFAPLKLLDHVSQVADSGQAVKLERRLCPDCARRIKAISMAGYSQAFRPAG